MYKNGVGGKLLLLNHLPVQTAGCVRQLRLCQGPRELSQRPGEGGLWECQCFCFFNGACHSIHCCPCEIYIFYPLADGTSSTMYYSIEPSPSDWCLVCWNYAVSEVPGDKRATPAYMTPHRGRRTSTGDYPNGFAWIPLMQFLCWNMEIHLMNLENSYQKPFILELKSTIW